MMILGHIIDTLQRRHWRRCWILWRRVRLWPVPVMRDSTWPVYSAVCRSMGLEPTDVFSGKVSVEDLPTPSQGHAAALCESLLLNASDYDLRMMASERRSLMVSMLLREFLVEAGARLHESTLESA